jgi:sulfonate transport system permease protein
MAIDANLGLETFTPARDRGRFTLVKRVRSPLGIYTSPLALLVLWQVACWLGMIPETIAASPIQVVKAGVHLWQVGAPSTLGEDLRVSLTRALVGLSRVGEQIFNGPVQILNTIPFPALLPVMIMWSRAEGRGAHRVLGVLVTLDGAVSRDLARKPAPLAAR